MTTATNATDEQSPWEPEHRGDEVLDRNGDLWRRGNKGWWHSWTGRQGGAGKLHWGDLQRMYGPTSIHKAKGVTANG